MIRLNTWIYDVEVAPNYFGVTFIPLKYKDAEYQAIIDKYIEYDIKYQQALYDNNLSDIEEILISKREVKSKMNVMLFEIYKLYDKDNNIINLNQINELSLFFQSHKHIYGYNSNNYDTHILKYVLESFKFINKEGSDIRDNNHFTWNIYKFSQKIIEFKDGFFRNDKRFKLPYSNYDIQKILYLDKTFVSLKQVAISLKWHRIQTLPFKYDQYIKYEDLIDIQDYNLNDDLITRQLILDQIEEVLLRESIKNEFNVNVLNDSRSSISNKIMMHYYSFFSKQDVKDFMNLRTDRYRIRLSDLIAKNISFKSESLNKLLDNINNTVVVVGSTNNDDKFKQDVIFGDHVYTMGLGGLHSQDSPDYFSNEDGYIYMDADVTSYYPSGIMLLKVYPAHLDMKSFLGSIFHITNSRVKAKKDPTKKAKAETLKITINAAYGKLKDKYSFLYDPKCTYTVTVNLQLYLLMLIEMLYEINIECISANTDGILCRYLPEQIDSYYKVIKEWESITGFTMEFATYNKYARSSVNDYIAIKDKDIKYKGSFTPTISFNKGYFAPVIAKAISEYMMNGTDYREYIRSYLDNNEKGIYDFCISQKSDRSFDIKTIQTVDGIIVTNEIQHSNRFYITSDKSCSIVKIKRETGKIDRLFVGVGIQEFNNYVYKEDYKLDYSFYTREVSKILHGSAKIRRSSTKGKKGSVVKDTGIIKSQLKLEI